MVEWKLGPHDLNGGEAGKRWARKANVVKAVGNPSVLHEAPDHAIRIWRWPFSNVEQDRFISAMDAEGFAAASVGPLNGYNHPNLWVEGPNEIAGGRSTQLCAFLIVLKASLERRGYKLTGPCWATGDYNAEDVERLRGVKLGLWTMHGYMSREYGPTIWNAYSMRQFWRPGDPPVVYSEAGYDRVRDAPAGGWAPPGDGPYGWQFQFNGHSDDETIAGLVRYAQGLDRPWEWGATIFTTSPNDEWRSKGFNVDPLADRLASMYVKWQPPSQGGVVVPEINLMDTPVEEMYSQNHFGPPRVRTDLVVVHATRSGIRDVGHRIMQEANVTALYMDNDGIPDANRVSSHYVIGDTKVFRIVHDIDTAWHAGYLNPRSIGVEIAQALPTTPYAPSELDFAARVVSRVCLKYGIPMRRIMDENGRGIIGHEDTAQGRSYGKTDPGALFNWLQFMALVSKYGGVAPVPPPPPVGSTWPNGRRKASSAEYDELVWTPIMNAANALMGGGNGPLGDDEDGLALLEIKTRNERRHGIIR